MTVLHIEHPITDFATWKSAFDRFASARVHAGCRGHRVLRPSDDDAYVMIHLDFERPDAAEAFLAFLHANVWSSREASPGLAGEPRTRILSQVEDTTAP